MKVKNYWEAIGVVAAHKAGIDPKSLRKYDIEKNAELFSVVLLSL
jgi:Protein of unknown function (DUF3326)